MRLRRKHSSGCYIWEEADKEELRDLYFEGYTDEEIAEMMERTPSAVQRMRSLLGLVKKNQPPKRFTLKGVLSEFYPKFYKDKLRKEWEQKHGISRR